MNKTLAEEYAALSTQHFDKLAAYSAAAAAAYNRGLIMARTLPDEEAELIKEALSLGGLMRGARNLFKAKPKAGGLGANVRTSMRGRRIANPSLTPPTQNVRGAIPRSRMNVRPSPPPTAKPGPTLAVGPGRHTATTMGATPQARGTMPTVGATPQNIGTAPTMAPGSRNIGTMATMGATPANVAAPTPLPQSIAAPPASIRNTPSPFQLAPSSPPSQMQLPPPIFDPKLQAQVSQLREAGAAPALLQALETGGGVLSGGAGMGRGRGGSVALLPPPPTMMLKASSDLINSLLLASGQDVSEYLIKQAGIFSSIKKGLSGFANRRSGRKLFSKAMSDVDVPKAPPIGARAPSAPKQVEVPAAWTGQARPGPQAGPGPMRQAPAPAAPGTAQPPPVPAQAAAPTTPVGQTQRPQMTPAQQFDELPDALKQQPVAGTGLVEPPTPEPGWLKTQTGKTLGALRIGGMMAAAGIPLLGGAALMGASALRPQQGNYQYGGISPTPWQMPQQM